jgi:hypothetical protein
MTEVMNKPDLTERARQYRALKAKIKQMEDDFDREVAPYKDALKDLKNLLLHTLNDMGVENVQTAEGTIHKTSRRTFPLEDVQEFQAFVIENRAWEMLDWKCNATAATDYMEEHKDLPPGVRMSVHIDSSVLAPKVKG